MNKEIELGDKVRCIHTGFEGTAICKSEFINGCVQWAILPKINKTSKTSKENIMPDMMPEEVGIDSQSLEVVSKKKVKMIKKEIGGPMRYGIKSRGF